jgi:acyl carrier protein
MNAVKDEIRRFIDDNFIMGTRDAPLAEADSFLEHHVLDSTGFLELIAFLEERWGIRVDDDEMLPENLDSLESVERFVQRKRGAAA